MLAISSALLELRDDAILKKKTPVSLSRKPCLGEECSGHKLYVLVEDAGEITSFSLSDTPVHAGVNTSNNNNVQDRQVLRDFLEFIGFNEVTCQ